MGIGYFDVWKKKMENNGGSITQSRLNDSKNFYNNNFKNDPSYKLATLKKKDINIDDSDLDTRIVNVDTNTKKKKIYVRPDTNIEVGDYIIYPNKTYLTLEVEDNLISPYASVEECNHLAKWMCNGVLNKILSIAENSTKYTEGIKTNTSGITEISAMFNLRMPNTPITKNLQEGQRIIVNGNAWRMTQVDFVTTKGLLSITLGKDSINSENDNLELEIADYYQHSYTITLDSTSQSLIETGTYQIKPTVKDEGKILLNPNITYKSSDETIATVSEKGLVSALKTGSCVITVSIGDVNTTLNLTVTAKTSMPVISYTCDWSTGKTSTGASLKTYMSSVVTLDETINGVSNSSLVANYSLDSIGTALLNAKSISITRQSNISFLVKNINVNTSKSFTITFTDSSDNSVINISTVNLTKGI